MVYTCTNKFIHFCKCQWKWWIFTKLRSSEVNIHHCSPSGLWLKLLSVQKVVLLQCINNQISQWRLAVRNVKKATSIKGLVHKFQAYCSHASKCLQLRHGALYKASRHHHDNIHMPLYSRNKNGMVCSWYFLLGKWL